MYLPYKGHFIQPLCFRLLVTMCALFASQQCCWSLPHHFPLTPLFLLSWSGHHFMSLLSQNLLCGLAQHSWSCLSQHPCCSLYHTLLFPFTQHHSSLNNTLVVPLHNTFPSTLPPSAFPCRPGHRCLRPHLRQRRRHCRDGSHGRGHP